MKKFIAIVLALGILIRLVLSFTTFHADVQPFDFAGKVIAQGNVLNFYDYLWQLPKNDPYLKVYPPYLFNYPPMVYFFLGGVSRLTTWMIDPVIHTNFILDFPSTLGNINLNFLLLMLKLPYLPFDILCAYMLMKLFKEEKKKKWIFALWMFNPVNLYATYMMGQFDIIPTFLSLAALYLVVKNKEKIESSNLLLPSLLLGLGAAFKIFPALFIIPLATLKSSWMDRLKIIFVGFGVYILTTFPFIFSKGFRATAMLANQTTKSLYAQIPISGGESIILFLAAIIFIYIVFWIKKGTVEDLWKRFFIMLLTFFVFTHYHPQWFLWITPFLLIDYVNSDFKHLVPIKIAFISFLGLLTFFDAGLTVWLFAPVNKALYGMPDLWTLVGIHPDVNYARSLLQTMFVGSALYYFYIHFPRVGKEK
jgi:hypothetical protein